MQLDSTLNFYKNKLFKNKLAFAKLYVNSLGFYIKKYNTHIHDPIPHKELNRIIAQPYQQVIEDFTSQQNDKLRFDLLEAVGYKNDKHPQMLSEVEKEKIISNLEKKLKLSRNHDIWMGKAWSAEEMENGLSLTIEKILAWNLKN